jgi:peptidase E
LTTVEGLGFIRGSHCPHYDAEGERKPLYWSKIKSGEFKSGFACDDKAGIYFENEEVKQVVALNQNSNAYFVTLAGNEVKETVLQKSVLPPAWP